MPELREPCAAGDERDCEDITRETAILWVVRVSVEGDSTVSCIDMIVQEITFLGNTPHKG